MFTTETIIAILVTFLLTVIPFTAIWYFIVLPAKRKAMAKEAKENAEKEAEVIKQKKLLEVKEKFLSKRAELEKEVRKHNQQIQQLNFA